jgi:hypothetical protein
VLEEEEAQLVSGVEGSKGRKIYILEFQPLLSILTNQNVPSSDAAG